MRLLITNIKSLLQVEEKGTAPRVRVMGADMKVLPSIEGAYLYMEDGLIVDYGKMADCPVTDGAEVIDATGRMVLPTWCDSHTHIVYHNSREGEFVDRINGLTYEEITERGGGIHNSAKQLQAASEEELYVQALRRLREVQGMGTGAIEIKSGYGLTVESELKMLRVVKRLRAATDMHIKATFLGAHAIPLAYKADRAGYLRLIIEEMLPQVVAEGLADFCDVFCETGFFTVEETAQVLGAARDMGLQLKVHANELYHSGGVQVGVQYGARSVDHLECTGPAEIAALVGSDTMPTLLPSTAFFLGLPYAPARDLIDAGLPVALSTDYNPGSTPSGNMPLVLSLACLKMRMTPAEAINAATINSAYAMDVVDELGSIAVGKRANVIITAPMPSIDYLPYAFGSNHIYRVIIAGQVQ